MRSLAGALRVQQKLGDRNNPCFLNCFEAVWIRFEPIHGPDFHQVQYSRPGLGSNYRSGETLSGFSRWVSSITVTGKPGREYRSGWKSDPQELCLVAPIRVSPNSVYACWGSSCLELDRFVDRVYATVFTVLMTYGFFKLEDDNRLTDSCSWLGSDALKRCWGTGVVTFMKT